MDLVTTDDVRTFLSLPATQDEALLASLVAAASSFALNYMNISGFSKVDYSETYNGTGSPTLVPDHRPLNSVASLTVDGRTIFASTSFTDGGYVADKYGVYLRSGKFARGIQNITINYNAGIDGIPEDVKQAVVEIIAEKYQRRTRMGISSKSIGQESISYTQNDMSPNAKAVFQQYKSRYLTA